MEKGDIVLIPFPFTDLSGSKLRPAVILISNDKDVIVAFLTTQVSWQEPTDIVLSPSPENGLKKISLLRTCKIATLDAALITGLMGRLTSDQLNLLNQNLRILFRLD
ncbi:MAG: type II toxin-antitoxin system PemK/MazF family toxin [Mucilaginibacter polytrichastri]|nr:type II toxin-antitoxin system PemK/MazF family toxin [Mucilaginibacter polytrichastri]